MQIIYLDMQWKPHNCIYWSTNKINDFGLKCKAWICELHIVHWKLGPLLMEGILICSRCISENLNFVQKWLELFSRCVSSSNTACNSMGTISRYVPTRCKSLSKWSKLWCNPIEKGALLFVYYKQTVKELNWTKVGILKRVQLCERSVWWTCSVPLFLVA